MVRTLDSRWGDIVFIVYFARHFALVVPGVNKGVMANQRLGITLQWTSITSRREN